MTNPDKQKNRGMKLAESEVKMFAKEKNLKIFQPERVKDNFEFIDTIKDLNPDIICVVAYGKILPKEILDIPHLGCINLHASLLPKYRGAAPIQWAVLNGDKVTGNSTMYMNERMDEGDIIFQEKTEIGEYETTGELWNRLKISGAELLSKTVREIEKGTAPRTPQGKYFTLAPMLNKEMAKIDFMQTATKIKNKVCGLNPIMGAYAMHNDKKIKFWRVEVLDDECASQILEKNFSEKIEPRRSNIIK
ncbi:MAG: methionyl-tRNA formyltransferase [Clostridia bacterium]|nr:methionyl-tRNA formyltransferase [Clostridia bacterium]